MNARVGLKGPGTVGSDKFGFGSLERKLDLVDQCQRDPSFMCARPLALGWRFARPCAWLRTGPRRGAPAELAAQGVLA